MTVRFLTRRYIGDYDPDLENTYSCSKCIDGENVSMEIRDTVAQVEHSRLESNIKWADAYILMYSITDRCSFNECSRLKVIINSYTKRNKNTGQTGSPCIPLVLVGNKCDQTRDRMISTAEGREKAYEMNSQGFYEISLQEERDAAFTIIADLYRQCKRPGNRRSELQQRFSCPPSLHFSPDVTDGKHSAAALQRRRQAIYTIS